MNKKEKKRRSKIAKKWAKDNPEKVKIKIKKLHDWNKKAFKKGIFHSNSEAMLRRWKEGKYDILKRKRNKEFSEKMKIFYKTKRGIKKRKAISLKIKNCWKNGGMDKTLITREKNRKLGKYDKKQNEMLMNAKHNIAISKGGYYKGIFMRSPWEIIYAKYLDKNKIKWKYECKIFKFKNGQKYVPDFYLPETDEWIEIKGWMDERSKLKIELFKKEFPNLKFKIYRAEDVTKWKKKTD